MSKKRKDKGAKRVTGEKPDRDVLPYYTQAEVAKMASLTRYAVNVAIRRGRIRTALTLDGVPLIPKDEAERWLADRGPVGRHKDKPPESK